MENTLLLGNGINYMLYSGNLGWYDLFKDNKGLEVNNCTFLYEACLLNANKEEDKYKEELIRKIEENNRPEKMKTGINGIDHFGKLLEVHQVTNILTTNVDTGIETILTEKNSFNTNDDRWSTENIYSIRRKKTFSNGSHDVDLWKIHGDVNTIASVSLGFDQYCGSLSKIDAYVKGKYSSSKENTSCKCSMIEKCKDNTKFDNLSWIELFFKTNVYFACFGMDFSEIDLWWLLNKRKRFIKDSIPIKNKIVFLYSSFDTGENEKDIQKKTVKTRAFEEKKYMFETFGVECRQIEMDGNFISNIFNQIK